MATGDTQIGLKAKIVFEVTVYMGVITDMQSLRQENREAILTQSLRRSRITLANKVLDCS